MAELTWRDKRPLAELQANWLSLRPQTLITRTQYPAQDCSPNGNWSNRLIYADRKIALQALLPQLSGACRLIYIDPPFMTGKIFTSGQQVAYHDLWSDLDSYLNWLYETFVLLHALLAADGSLYVHLDWRATHHARLLLDEIFGGSPQKEGPGFQNEIIWHYQSGGRTHRRYARKHDSILLYTRSARYYFQGQRIAVNRGSEKRNHMRQHIDENGKVFWTIRSNGRVYTYHEDSPMLPSDVWSDISHLHQKDPERTGYATQKPAALLERIILASSDENDLVLDCCCGSGVTAVVAEQLKRRWIACDQSEVAITTTRDRLLALPARQAFVLQEPERQ
jgi:site-specific DNA-methyltransferase (adenine-specific)/adenine-specific DNA-methyltransferase